VDAVRHGPESLNPDPGSAPKYPVTAFNPDGSVVSLKNDAELQGHFNAQNEKGQDLKPNEAWGWNKDPDGRYSGKKPR